MSCQAHALKEAACPAQGHAFKEAACPAQMHAFKEAACLAQGHALQEAACFSDRSRRRMVVSEPGEKQLAWQGHACKKAAEEATAGLEPGRLQEQEG